MNEVASAVGLEPTTSGLGNLRSILMSYAECEQLDTMRNLQKKVYTCLYFLTHIKVEINQLLRENIML